MARIAFILLCHKNPDGVIRQARQLTAVGDTVAIHFDARAPRADYHRIRAALADNPGVVFARRRLRCGWGQWSIVQATLHAVEAAVEAFPRATHFYMVSGDCMAIKSAAYAHALLDARDVDHIESFDFHDSDWIKTGLKEERLIYRHWFNERARKGLFYASLGLQRWLGLRRAVPDDLQMMIGSQWWCLRRPTMEAVLGFCRARPDVMRFFRTTWIPDETFFQTLVRHLVPEPQIVNRTLTFLMFSDYGMPVTFYDDHYDLLLGQDALFARKVSPEALELRARLGDLYASDRADFSVSDEGRQLFQFLTGRGRIGRRFAPRFWERETSLGRDKELLIVACRKFHVAKRLLGSIKHHTNIPTIEYLFDEEDTWLPDLGGIESTLDKRARHRLALVRMLFEFFETERLIICLDTASIELIRGFYSDRSRTRLLEVDCDFSDTYLIEHAKRVGLAGADAAQASIDRLLPTIRHDIVYDSERLRDANFPNFGRISDRASPPENAVPIQAFLSVPHDVALGVAETAHLFSD